MKTTLLLQALSLLLWTLSACLAQQQQRRQQRQQQQQRQKANLNLNDLGSLLGGLSNEGESGPECPSHCSSAVHPHPAPKPRIRPYSNGCSVPPFLRESLGDYSHFTQCCDLHDACYMTCGATKSLCDTEFGKCMKKTCRAKFKGRNDKTEKCTSMASTFELGVSMFGCNGYTDYQKEGCDCVSTAEASRRVKDYAEDFYSHYNGTHPLPDAIKSKYLSGEKQKPNTHGELLYRLYRKYPESIEIISRNGMDGREGPTYFKSEERGSEL